MPADLNRRIDELSRELRTYPTPIARCDEQLAALLGERARLIARRDALESEPRCGPDAQWTNDGGMHAA
jgi:hypothetical protein